MEKSIRQVLNKVSEGNIEPMFTALTAVVTQYLKPSSKPSIELAQFAKAYAKIFITMNIAASSQLTAILSTNCALICALQRSIKGSVGDHFFSLIIVELHKYFVENHLNEEGKDRIKNLMNAFLHFFLFHSVTHALIYDLINLLLTSFKETEIEILIFVMHNIGL